METKIKITNDGKIKFSMESERTRLEDLGKWLRINRDAILVKLEGPHDTSMKYKPGHKCRIEEDDDEQKYNVFVGKHFIGHLPEEAIAFAESIDYCPDVLIAIVGKVEPGASAEEDEIYIYVAE